MSSTHQKILDTAGRLFRERGYELVGVNEIIDTAGVAKATFYQQFRSKEKLCVDWLRREASSSNTATAALLKSDLSPLEKLEQKYELLKGYFEKGGYRACVFSNTASMMPQDNEVREVVRDYKQASRLFWQALALEFTRDPVHARVLGDGLFLLFSGAATEAQNARSMWPVESAREAARLLCTLHPPAA